MEIPERFKIHRYSRYFSSLPLLYQSKEVVVYTELILSLLTITLLVIFALSPTATAITTILKEKESAIQTNTKLQEKINSLHQAQTNYNAISQSLPLIFQTLPQKPTPAEIASQFELLAEGNNLDLTSLSFDPVELKNLTLKKTASVDATGARSFSLRITLKGTFKDITNFLAYSENLSRLITVDSLSLSSVKNEEGESQNLLSLNLSGKAYFLQSEIK